MARKKLTEREVQVIDRLVGVKPEDSKIEKARKGIEVMKLAGFPQREINKAERMLADAIARGVK